MNQSKSYLRYILIILAFSGYACEVVAQNSDTIITPDPAVKIGKLPNGLTYYIRKNTEPRNRAELRLVVKAGSVLEDEDQLGLAHFTEHMAFNGTKHFKKNELISFLELNGVEFGADLNAYTSFDETVYMLKVPTDSPGIFLKSFQVLEDWAHNVTFENEEIEKERGVVIEEWRTGLGAQERIMAKYLPVLLNESRYSRRLPIGTKKSLETFKPSSLRRFYKDWYRPDLQAIVAVGDFDPAVVEELIKQHFLKIKASKKQRLRAKFSIPLEVKTSVLIVTDTEEQRNKVQVFYKHPSASAAPITQKFRTNIVRELFNHMMNNRLREASRSNNKPFVTAYGSYTPLFGDIDIFTLAATISETARADSALKTVLIEIERVKKYGFTETELERAKTYLLANMENSYNERGKTRSGTYVEQYVNHFLKNDPIIGIEKEFDLYRKYLPGVLSTEVNSLIHTWTATKDVSVVITAHESEKHRLPQNQDITKLLNSPVNDIAPYKDTVNADPLISHLLPAGTIRSSTKHPQLGITEITLSNGARVIIKPTEFKNEEILLSAISKGGAGMYSPNDYHAATISPFLVNFSGLLGAGLGNYNITALRKYLSGKKVSLMPLVSNYEEMITGSCRSTDIETALQLMYLYFTAPRKDNDYFKVFKLLFSSLLKYNSYDPESVFTDSVQCIMSNYHPSAFPISAKSIDTLDYDKAYKIYRERFSDASDFIFVIVGNVDTTVLHLLEKYIGALPSASILEQPEKLGVVYAQAPITRRIAKGKENKSAVKLIFSGDALYSEKDATELSLICKILEIKLLEILREQLGGVYSAYVQGDLESSPENRFTITIGFDCNPAKTDTLIYLTLNQVQQIQRFGPESSAIQKVINEALRRLETQLRENEYWLNKLQFAYLRGESPTVILEEKEYIKNLSAEKAKELFIRYFDTTRVAKFTLVPETDIKK